MTIKEIDKKLSKIKKDIHNIEEELIYKTTRDKNKRKLTDKKKFIRDWEKLAKEVTAKWDNVSITKEIKYQREKGG